MTAYLRQGSKPDVALRVLHEVLIHASNACNGFDQQQVLHSYLNWVEQAERQLRNVFGDPCIWESLYSDRHWRIRQMGNSEPRPLPLIRMEVERQIERLEHLKSKIQALQDWAGRSDGRCVVLDTNVLLHHLPPQQIDWKAVVGSDRPRLVVPIRVVEELDQKKYARNDRLAKRARSVLSDLGGVLLSTADEPVTVRDAIVLEIAPFDEPRDRPLDADLEILRCCLTLSAYCPDLVLVTGDTSMRIRAQGLKIEARLMPSRYMRTAAESPQ